jgi:hypothetical protein
MSVIFKYSSATHFVSVSLSLQMGALHARLQQGAQQIELSELDWTKKRGLRPRVHTSGSVHVQGN